MMKIAIDVGSGYVKYFDGKKENAFLSLVAPYKDAMTNEFGVEKDSLVSFEEKTFLTGEDAYLYGKKEDRFSTLNTDWHGGDSWRALLYRVISDLGVTTGDIKIAVGLPQKEYANQKNKLLKVLNGQHKFYRNGVEHLVYINGLVMPQCSATIFDLAEMNEHVLTSMVGSIDIGTFTTGFSVVDEMRFIPRLSGGITVGMSDLYQILREDLTRIGGFKTDDAKFARIVRDKKIVVRGETFDLTENIKSASASVAGDIIRKAMELWGGGSDMLLFLTGGGAPYFISNMKDAYPHIQLIENPFFSVARGMYVYLSAQE